MHKSDLEVLASQTAELARRLINSEFKDGYIRLIERYNSSLAQYIQILETFPEDKRSEIPSASMLISLHEELEKSMLSKKAGLKEMIISLNSGMSLKKKYYGANISRTGLDRKG